MLIGVIAGHNRVPTGPSPLWSRQYFAFSTAQWYLGSYDTYTHTHVPGQPTELVLAGDQPWGVQIAKGNTPIDTTEVRTLYFVLKFESLFDDNGTWDNPGFKVQALGDGGSVLKTSTFYPDGEFINTYGRWDQAYSMAFFFGGRPNFGDIKHLTFSNAGQGSERVTVLDLAVNDKPLVKPTGPVAVWNEWYWNSFNHHIEGGNAANTAHPNWDQYKFGVAGQHERKLSIWSQQPLELSITPRNNPPIPALCKALELNLEVQTGNESAVKPITFEVRNGSDVLKGIYRWTPTFPLVDGGMGSQVTPVRIDLVEPSDIGSIRVLDPNPLNELRVYRTLRDPVFVQSDGLPPKFISSNYTESGSAAVMVWEAKPDKPAEQQFRVEGAGEWSIEFLFNGTTYQNTPIKELWVEVEFNTSFEDVSMVVQPLQIEVYNHNDDVINGQVTYAIWNDKITTNGSSRQHYSVRLTEGGPFTLADVKLLAIHHTGDGANRVMKVRNIAFNERPALQSIGPIPFWHNWYWKVENKLDSTKALDELDVLLWQDNGYPKNYEYFFTQSKRPLDLWFTPRNGVAIPAVTKAVKFLFNYSTNPGDVLFEVIGSGNAVLGSLLWNTSVSTQVDYWVPLELIIELTTPGQVIALRMLNDNPNNADLGYRMIRDVQFSADGVYALWNGPGWFDVSDSSTIQTSGSTVTGLLNKRHGYSSQHGMTVENGDLVGGGGTTRTIQAAAQNGRNALAVTRDAIAPVRFVADSTTALSQVFQGNDKPFTVIVAYRPTDTNNGYIWSGSRTIDSSNEHVVGVVRRSTPNSSFRKQIAANSAPDANWGTGQAQNVNRIVAVRHTGTAVTVWDTGLTKVVDNVAQDTPAISNLAKFALFAAQTKGSSEGYALVQSSMLFFEIVVEDKVRTDAEITKAMTDMAAKWGITLGA